MFSSLLFHGLPPLTADFFSLTNRMLLAPSITMINFRKSATCPSSQNLVDFQKSELLPDESRAIREHLPACEFCAAEVEFYARFPQSEVVCAETKIPGPLYQLAEALLSNQQKKFTLLKQLISENEKKGKWKTKNGKRELLS